MTEETEEKIDNALHQKVAGAIALMIPACNSITDDELAVLLNDIARESAIGPLLDPTLWSHGGKMRQFEGMRKVLMALRTFKREVSGIGRFV